MASTVPANASWISIRSKSARLSPLRSSRTGIARVGASSRSALGDVVGGGHVGVDHGGQGGPVMVLGVAPLSEQDDGGTVGQHGGVARSHGALGASETGLSVASFSTLVSGRNRPSRVTRR